MYLVRFAVVAADLQAVCLHEAELAVAAWNDDVKAEYKKWASSYGLVPPKGPSVDGNVRVHAQLKDVVALEGWARTPDAVHQQMNLLFAASRTGDVYAVPLDVPATLAVDGLDVLPTYAAPVGDDDPSVGAAVAAIGGRT